MFATKTVCRPGAYIEAVPAGLLAKLQYNQRGLLEKICIEQGEGTELREVDKQLFTLLAEFVPNSVGLSGGTTWVSGVFYTPNIPHTSGKIPFCLYDEYEKMVRAGEQFTFYASTAKSNASSIKGPMIIRNWLEMSKFNTLPGIVVPQNFTEDTLKMLFNTTTTKFVYPYISGYVIFENLVDRYVEEDLYQTKIKSLSAKLTEYGEMKAHLTTDTGKIVVPYSDAVMFDAQCGSSILFVGGTSKILSARKYDTKKRDRLARTLECPVCHKMYAVPLSGPVLCDDPDCASRMFSQICRMTAMFKLPAMDGDKFLKLVKDKQILALSDVLDLPEYKELKFDASVAEVLAAATPVEICADTSVFEQIAHACSQNIKTLMYYLNNPSRMLMELNVHSVPGERFAKWLETNSNILTIEALLSRVHIKSKDFNIPCAAPIFRGRKFILTGGFKRGNYHDIVSILANYGAEVTTDIDEHPDCIVVGSLLSNIDGNILRKGDAAHIVRYDEDDFFESFGIDDDMARSNLL